MVKIFFLFIIAFLPQVLKRHFLTFFYGFEISKSSYIGLSLLNVKHLVLKDNARIGHLNVFKGLEKLIVGSHSSIGNLNWITGFPSNNSKHFSHLSFRTPSLLIGVHSAITNRHLIDCTAEFKIGDFTTFAGFRSQVLTHSIDLKLCRQNAIPIEIGDYCFVGTNCVLLPGARLPNRSILAANSLLVDDTFKEEYVLYGGVPAQKIKHIDPSEYDYFGRLTGFVV
jgi:acetyltransferase-like isoleucine patch superfamily enzyme